MSGKGTKEGTLLLCKYLFKYKAWSIGSALAQLMNVDYIRNNYTKNTLYTYLSYVRHFAKNGKIVKKCPPMLSECIKTYAKQADEPREEFIEITKPSTKIKNEIVVEKPAVTKIPETKEPTTLEKYKDLSEKLNQLKVNYERITGELISKRDKINAKIDKFEVSYKKIKDELSAELKKLDDTLYEEILLGKQEIFK